jgi:3-oxoadipate enol-lactonase
MDRRSRGEREYEALTGMPPGQGLGYVARRSPQLYDDVIEGAFGGPLARAELGRAGRQVATIAILAAAGGAEPQLAVHASAALRAGVAAAELRALCEQVAVYAGFPRALNALAVIDQVLADAGIAQPPAMRRVALADHETVVAQLGNAGPDVILVHALGLDWRMWEPVMGRLSAGRRVFAYDVRGHGWAAGAPAPFTMAGVAADLVGVLDGLGLDRAHLAGLSYGGSIAQTAVLSHPGRFLSLTLMATTDHPFGAFEDRARAGERDGMAAQVAPTLTRWFTPEAVAENGWGVRYARERIRRGDPRDWAASWRAMKGIDVQDRLGTLGLPSLLLAGERDASTTPEIMAAIASQIPGSIYQELPATPHMQTLEQPELAAAALGQFLPAQQSPAAASR